MLGMAADPQAVCPDRVLQLVYELYGLTDEEIRIVEEATAPKARKDEV